MLRACFSTGSAFGEAERPALDIDDLTAYKIMKILRKWHFCNEKQTINPSIFQCFRRFPVKRAFPCVFMTRNDVSRSSQVPKQKQPLICLLHDPLHMHEKGVLQPLLFLRKTHIPQGNSQKQCHFRIFSPKNRKKKTPLHHHNTPFAMLGIL